MTQPPEKSCAICRKSVLGAKHIKDKRGRYYCTPCYEAALARQRAAAATVPASASAPNVPADDDDLLPEVPSKSAPPVVVASKPVPVALLEFCPNCGAKVIGNRKICFKCNRDITQMDALIAHRAAAAEEEARGPSGTEIFATWFGRVSRVALWIVCIVVIVFILWGLKLQFMGEGPWDHYPTSREVAVREFLKHIATGTDKGYTKAYKLISWRESTTGTPGEDAQFKQVFARMHDDFVRKYGADWYSKIKLENIGSNDLYADDEVDFRLTLGKDSCIIATQVQIDVTRAAANMALPKMRKPVYNEDGKLHFGILDVDQYKVRETRRMVDMVGPGHPEKLDFPVPIPQ